MTSAGTRIHPSTKLYYGVGSAAYGVKDNGFAYFLLFFYSQVLGLPAGLASLAIMIALIVDAFSDPIIGWLSDNWKSRLGRRHPFMYASVIPIGLSYFLLWNPPELVTVEHKFFYLLAFSILVRTFITLYEIPSSALVAELTTDYDQRTSYLSYRLFFGFGGGIIIAMIAYAFLLTPTEEDVSGLLNESGYRTYGVIATGLIVASILICTIGTHRYIPRFKALAERGDQGPGHLRKDLWNTLSNRSFLAIFSTSIFAFVAGGLVGALNLYLNRYFWEFTSLQLLFFVMLYFVAALIALILTPRLSRNLEKKTVAMGIWTVAAVMLPMPVLLRLIGVLPENGTDALFWIIAFYILFEITLIVMASIIVASMIADLVEDNERRTGRRTEGLFFAARTFAQKTSTGLGIFIAGIIVSIIQLPTAARPEDVDPEVIRNLGLFYGVTISVLYLCSIVCLSFYSISRKQHEDNLTAVQAQALEPGPYNE